MSTTTTTVTGGDGGGGESIFSPPLTLVTPSVPAKESIPALEICPTGDIIISLIPEPPTPPAKPKSKDPAPAPAPAAAADAIPEKPKPLRFRVSSSVLCAASPVFNAMLGPKGKFAEAAALRQTRVASSPEEVQNAYHVQPLYDDNGTALAVILYALHLQTHKVPRTVSFTQLKQLAIVCDKYDCVGAVRLWAETWMEPWRSYVSTQGYEDWLFIAWVFSSRKFFGRVSKSLVPRIVVSEDEAGGRVVCWAKYKGRGSERLDKFDNYVPEVILNALLKQRNTIVKEVVTLCSSTFTKYASGAIPLCKHVPNDPRCDTYLLGALYRAFAGIGMLGFDVKSVDSYSIQELVEAIRAIRIKNLDYDGWGQVEVEEEEVEAQQEPEVQADVVVDVDAEANADANDNDNADANANANANADADANANADADANANANADANAVVAADVVAPDANAEPNADANADANAVVAADVVASDANAEPNADANAAGGVVIADAAVNQNAEEPVTDANTVVADGNDNNADAAVITADAVGGLNADANADENANANEDENADANANANAEAAVDPVVDANANANANANAEPIADAVVDVNPNTDTNAEANIANAEPVENADAAAEPIANAEANIEPNPNANDNAELNADANAVNANTAVDANANADANPDANANAITDANAEQNPDVPTDANVNPDTLANDIAIAVAATEEVEAPPPAPEPEAEAEDETPPPPPKPKKKMAHIRHEHGTTCNPMKALLKLVEEEAEKTEELNLTQFRGWKRKKLEKDGGNWAKLTEELEVAMVGL